MSMALTDRIGRGSGRGATEGTRPTAREGQVTERDGAPAHRDPGEIAREHQHEEFGGLNWGAAFFGWLVAVGLGAILTALLSAAGAAIGFSEDNAETLGLVGAIGLVVIAFLAYFAGGYVAGRMSRFDGARQGFGVWAWALIVAIVLAILGAIAGAEYNVFGALELPRIPVDEGDVGLGAAITLVAMALVTLLGAVLGGKAGERYHRRVDAAGTYR
jgi:hypothetical protein